jgi:hypothetical protein
MELLHGEVYRVEFVEQSKQPFNTAIVALVASVDAKAAVGKQKERWIALSQR